jgi:GH15 family glucan-1,4-alpha-glucosidase
VRDLDLAPIGNCSVSALVDARGRMVWWCAPRIDSDPVFCALLDGAGESGRGHWTIQLLNQKRVEQAYVGNTAILRTLITDDQDQAIEIIDFAPRFRRNGRTYRPTALCRRVRPVRGAPRISIQLRPAADWGARAAERTFGSNHIRYLARDLTLRLTTDCPVSHLLSERPFRLEQPITLFLGPDEPFQGRLAAVCAEMLDETQAYWREWVRTLAVPLDWQDAVIRAAITLKLCAYEETGAIVAAMTTSIPEAPDSGRNWDYRYCWIRDAYYVVRALSRLGAADLLENYLGFLRNLVDASAGGHVQPVYGVGFEAALPERQVTSLAGYRGMGPVRVGNQAHEHQQHDAYGQIVLPLVQSFFDRRLFRPGTVSDFEALERVADRAYAVYLTPDAGLWEFRGRARVHTYSALLSWAACDRLAKAAAHLGLSAREAHWSGRADEIRKAIEARAWNPELGRFAASFDGEELDASLLQLVDLGLIDPADPRQAATFAAVEGGLRQGAYVFRYTDPDDFGAPETAFNFCTFWFIEALHLAGRTDEAREMFESMLALRNHVGLLSEDTAVASGEAWGNFPQTYALVGLITCAVLLSRPWSAVR